MGFIEELYNGNISPTEKRFVQGTKYAKAMSRACNNEEKLMELLSGDNLKLFEGFVEASCEIGAISDTENFKLGFRLGVQAMCDCLVNEDTKVFTDIEE
ncbi:MAG: hypothetical protein IKW64_07460 [Clostridia bacterium]|nr:hypothetical protein [Clostridia bacterium]